MGVRWLFAVCLAATLTPVAYGQNSVTEHYRAYTSALERGDLAAAATEAELALIASRARDGDGGSTGVLALNLANVQLDRGEREAAIAPASLALSIAQARGAEARLDPIVAELTLLRARLSSNVSASALWAAMERSATAEGGYDERFYAAAAALGDWAMAHSDYPLSAAAWRAGTQAVIGSDEEAVLARARALRGLGLSLLLENARRGHRTTLLGTNVDRVATDALEPLSEATRITRTLVLAQSPDGPVTHAQFSYAQSLGLLVAARSQLNAMMGLGMSAEVDPTLVRGLAIAAPNALPRCTFTWSTERPLRYPRRLVGELQVGAVVMRFVLREDGSVAEATPLAVTGAEDFADVAAGARWSANVEPGQPACTAAGTYITPLSFTIR